MADERFRAVKAFHNPVFLEGQHARALRILSEYLEPEARFEELRVSDTIVFFGSTRTLTPEAAREGLGRAQAEGGDVTLWQRRVTLSRYYEEARELAYRLTEWSKGLAGSRRRFVVCTGGGPGIMEAANRGASEAKGLNMGLNIALPHEQESNPYITRQLAFEFHYFFMRKFWFMYMAKAVVIFPGGFGTLDELFEAITLVQTGKITKRMPIILYGGEFWDKVLNFETLIEYGVVAPEDMAIIHRVDSVDEAFTYITQELAAAALDKPGGRM